MPPPRRWPGGSGGSNPTVRKHRDKALAQFRQVVGGHCPPIPPRTAHCWQQKPKGRGGLSSDALRAHNARMDVQDADDREDQLVQDSDDPFASVRMLWNSQVAAHKEVSPRGPRSSSLVPPLAHMGQICAVFAAITEVVNLPCLLPGSLSALRNERLR
jgi:hypothetical protein